MKHPTTPILAARCIVKGDAQQAYELMRADPRVSLSVPEARALSGACRRARELYGANLPLRWGDFLAPIRHGGYMSSIGSLEAGWGDGPK